MPPKNRVVLSNGDGVDLVFDPATSALSVIDYPHSELHSGNSFHLHISNTTASSDDDRTAIGFEVPNTTKWIHLVVSISTSSPAEFFMTEDVTIDDDEGTQLVALNRNRNSANVSTVLSFEGTAQAGEGTWFTEAELAAAQYSAVTTLEHVVLAGGSGPFEVGGQSRGSQEWMLKAGKKYLFFLQNIGANANVHNINLNWYEHTSVA